MALALVRSQHIATPGGRHYRVRTVRTTLEDPRVPQCWDTEVYCATEDGVQYGKGAIWIISPRRDVATWRHERVVNDIRDGAEHLLFWLRDNVD